MNEKQDMSESMAQLGSIIKHIRQCQNLTRAQFAEATGLTEKTILNIENGQRSTMQSFLMILNYLSLHKELPEWLSLKVKALCETP